MSKNRKYGYPTSDNASAPNPPKTLRDNPFFGINLDSDQQKLRDLIWSDDIDIVFSNSASGTGKSTISIATAFLLCQYGKFQDIVYVMHPSSDIQGSLPGSITEKSEVYFEALYQTLIRITHEWPGKFIKKTSMTKDSNDTGFITAIMDTYLRGSNIGGTGRKTVLIIDEAQNFPEHALRKTLTRACEGTKVIVIGHSYQCDLTTSKSGFDRCIRHFNSKNNPRFAFCNLKICHRSLVAEVADEDWGDEMQDDSKRLPNKATVSSAVNNENIKVETPEYRGDPKADIAVAITDPNIEAWASNQQSREDIKK